MGLNVGNFLFGVCFECHSDMICPFGVGSSCGVNGNDNYITLFTGINPINITLELLDQIFGARLDFLGDPMGKKRKSASTREKNEDRWERHKIKQLDHMKYKL